MATNQDPGFTVEACQNWWRRNRHKTQEEWVREGFESAGLRLESPLSMDDIRALLLMVGRKGATPRHLFYNALRWLRDSDFDPRSFTVSDLTRDDGQDLLNGLIRYSQWTARYPKGETPGVLAIGSPPGEAGIVFDWLPTKPWFVASVHAALAAALVAGILCMRLGWRSSREGR